MPTETAFVVINDQNSAEYVAFLLESLRGQAEAGRLEKWLIDDASTDQAEKLAAGAGFKCFRFDRKVASRAELYNQGLDVTTAEHLIFAHSDIVLEEDFFQRYFALEKSARDGWINFGQYYADKIYFGKNQIGIDVTKMAIYNRQVFHTPSAALAMSECTEACFKLRRLPGLHFDQDYLQNCFEYEMLAACQTKMPVSYQPQLKFYHYFTELAAKQAAWQRDKNLWMVRNERLLCEAAGPQSEKINILGAKVREQQGRIARLQGDLMKTDVVAELKARVEKAENELAACSAAKQDLENFYQSRGGRLLRRYHVLRDRLLPPGSWRRRVLQTLLRVGRASVFKGRKQRKAEHSRDSAVYLEQFKAAEQLASHRLRNWLATDHRMVFPVFQKPRVSIILLVYNKAALTFQCLETIKAYADEPFELIIVDNASADETGEMLSRLANVKIIRNLDNVGFIRGCNQGVDEATGDHLLFLNNDTQIQPGTISALVRTLDSDPVIGAVGGRLIFPDRTLQEAGSIIWRDGSCLGYGRGDNPFRGEYSFPREVHFCSGALLMTPRRLFEKLGKFDERYLPAYYEEADYCMRLREAGYQVWYQPKAIVIHYEFASGNRDQAISLQIENQKKFVQRWSRQLQVHPESQPENICLARMANNTKQRILYIDDIVPDNRAGSGYPRTRKIVEILSRVGYFVTYYPLQCAKRQEEVMRPLEEMGVEIISVPEDTKLDFAEFFKNRKGYYQIALVSRPHNMAEVARELGKQKEGMKIIYDAEAIFSLREALYNEVVQRRPLDSKKVEQLVRAEVEITKNADCILAVSEREKELFHRYGATNVHVLGHVAERCPTPASFEERRDLLFVGGILNSPSPNEDAVLFFARQIFPRIRKELNCKLLVVGTNKSKAVRNLHSEEIKVIGRVDDLFPYYNQCRLFVVPTRYSGGIPLKLTEAAAHGLPSVVTPLISQQIGWVEDGEMSVGHTDIDFADKVIQLYRDKNMWMKMRQAALERVGTEYNEEQFESKLRSALLSV